jgi:hypothetical protein
VRTTYLSDKILNHVYRNTAMTSPTTVYASLLTAVTDAEAGTITETAYAGYARVAITFGAPAASVGGRRIQNSSSITFGQKTDAGTIVAMAVGIHDALTVGNLLDVCYLDASAVTPFEIETTDTAGDTLTSVAHGMAANQQVRFEQTPAGGSLPAGISENVTYFVIATGLTADVFKISTTQGGGALDITASGMGVGMRLTPITINQNDTPQFAANALSVLDD